MSENSEVGLVILRLVARDTDLDRTILYSLQVASHVKIFLAESGSVIILTESGTLLHILAESGNVIILTESGTILFLQSLEIFIFLASRDILLSLKSLKHYYSCRV